ncbi:hypothetical protein [Arenibacter amylolyticus]|uniref:hypothetical protein n=1 Tax=Arenibacter amylolyticus TaxID=1406873 RepID=UPI00112376BE|nr:hypothetical protein [Arenibacter amylolyticus]
MTISMQGNWTVAVKSKSASYPQRFVIQGANSGNGSHSGTNDTSVSVTGTQWSISIQNDPGTGWQASETQLKFPVKTGSNYVFDIHSNDAGGDSDYNDLILTCSTPVNVNDFIIFGNVTLYGGRCIFNPCRRFPWVIETHPALERALKNPLLSDYIKTHYPERVPLDPEGPVTLRKENYFKPMVLDLSGEAMKPNTTLAYRRTEGKKDASKSKKILEANFSESKFELINSSASIENRTTALSKDRLQLIESIEGLFFSCTTNPGSNLTLSFEEYDRTAAELMGGTYTGTGNRTLLGDTITDMNGNYIFKFSFDMTVPGLEDAQDIAPGEDVNTIIFPDVIVKIVDFAPYQVLYESAPFYNIPNLRRINLCLPESILPKDSPTCFNGNLIGSLGNVFIGGDQNSTGSFSPTNLTRYGNSNYLEPSGIISVESPLAGFGVQCAAWRGTIDMKGCMYDATKSAADNKIKWYTIRIRRAGTSSWVYVTQNYKHPKYSNRNLPNYIGDDVGPFYPAPGSTLDGSIPAYKNIQREIFVDGEDWEFSNLSRYMRLNTLLHDIISGERTPGRFFLRVDGYDTNGAHVSGATDLIALFIHNKELNFAMTTPTFNDPSIINVGCGLFHLTDSQLKTPITFTFKATENYEYVNEYGVLDSRGFVDNYHLTIGRCPSSTITLTSNLGGDITFSGSDLLSSGENDSNIRHGCPGYTGTQDDYMTSNAVGVQIEPTPSGPGWILTADGETFSVYTFGLTANQRVTNGYNNGLSGTYRASGRIMMEYLAP